MNETINCGPESLTGDAGPHSVDCGKGDVMRYRSRKWRPHAQVWPRDYYGDVERARSEVLAVMVCVVVIALAVGVPLVAGFWVGQRVATPAAYQQGYADGMDGTEARQ